MFRILLLGLFVCKSQIAIAQESANKELSTTIQAIVANAASWRQYDCLVRIESLEDKKSDPAIKLEHVRFIADLDEKKVTCVYERNRTVFNEKTGEKTGKSLKGVVSSNTKLHFVEFPGSKTASRVKLQSILHDFGVLDVRGIGLSPFPLSFYPEGDLAGFENYRLLRSDTLSGNVKGIDDFLQLQVISSVRSDGPKKMDVVTSYLVDKQSLVPTEWKRAKRIPAGNTGKLFPGMSQKFKWKELEGCFVPVEIIVEDETSSTAENGKLEKYTKQVTVKIHWFSLNEPLEENLFEDEILDSVERIRSLVDPTKSGAGF